MEDDTGFTEEDGEFLIQVVKVAQQRKITGVHGQWHDYLSRVVDKKAKAPRDPAKRPWHVLANFLASFVREEDKKMVEHMRERHKSYDAHAEVPWSSSPEQELVELTRKDPNYKRYYSFPSHLETWVVIDGGKASGGSTPERMLSLDCEMGVGEDDNKHVLKLCVVDRNCEVLLDTFVKPDVHIKDYLTDITGVTAADLDGCAFSLADAQQKLQELLQPGVILVGHSLSYDLKVLQVDYPRVIDTYLIFRTTIGRKCGLNDLCQAVLGYSFREEGKAHDCLLDAVIPMKLVLHVLEHGRRLLELPEQTCMGPSLFLHKLPPWASPSNLRCLFSSKISCEIKMVSKSSSETSTAWVEFRSVEHANRAYNQLSGKPGLDKTGLPQKEVQLTSKEAFVRPHAIWVRRVRAPMVGPDVVRPQNLDAINEEGEDQAAMKKRPLTDLGNDAEDGEIVVKHDRKRQSKKGKSKSSRCISGRRPRF